MAKKNKPPTTQPKSGTTQRKPEPEDDPDIKALGDIIRVLEPLEMEAQSRILLCAAAFFDLDIEREK